MSNSPLVPRGAPLTQLMEFTDPNRRAWLAYVEATPPVRRWRLLNETVMPGRRVRFDSAGESRSTSMVPAGSPFLPELRLQVLLAHSTVLPAVRATEPSPAPAWQHGWELVKAAWWAGTRCCEIAIAAARSGLRHVISGYRALVSRGPIAFYR